MAAVDGALQSGRSGLKRCCMVTRTGTATTRTGARTGAWRRWDVGSVLGSIRGLRRRCNKGRTHGGRVVVDECGAGEGGGGLGGRGKVWGEACPSSKEGEEQSSPSHEERKGNEGTSRWMIWSRLRFQKIEIVVFVLMRIYKPKKNRIDVNARGQWGRGPGSCPQNGLTWTRITHRWLYRCSPRIL